MKSFRILSTVAVLSLSLLATGCANNDQDLGRPARDDNRTNVTARNDMMRTGTRDSYLYRTGTNDRYNDVGRTGTYNRDYDLDRTGTNNDYSLTPTATPRYYSFGGTRLCPCPEGNATTRQAPTTPAPAQPAPTTPAPSPAKPTPTAPAAPSPADAGLTATEAQVIELTNAERRKSGLPDLKADTSLSKVAQVKSDDMLSKNYFSHTSPTYGSPFDMMKRFGVSYSYAGENIAKGQRSAQEVVQAWMNSTGHRANILNKNYTHIGIGHTTNQNYWTQMFITK